MVLFGKKNFLSLFGEGFSFLAFSFFLSTNFVSVALLHHLHRDSPKRWTEVSRGFFYFLADSSEEAM